jgi:uncharacterized protein YqeY
MHWKMPEELHLLAGILFFKMALTTKQKEIAERVVKSIKSDDIVQVVRKSIKKENEYFLFLKNSQRPAKKQFYQTFDI